MIRNDRKNEVKINRFLFILLGLITPLLLTSLTYASGIEKIEKSLALVNKLSASHVWQNDHQLPLAPISAFTLQTSLCKFLDSCPTSGTTVSQDEPPDEEVTEDDLM